jgi:hypothetical protein
LRPDFLATERIQEADNKVGLRADERHHYEDERHCRFERLPDTIERVQPHIVSLLLEWLSVKSERKDGQTYPGPSISYVVHRKSACHSAVDSGDSLVSAQGAST